MPLDLYINIVTNQSAIRNQDYPVEASIRNAAEAVWRRMRGARSRARRPDTVREATLERAKTIASKTRTDLERS